MPLLAYFATVGTLLTALLLLVNFMLEPSKPEGSGPASAGIQTNLPKPRTTTGLAPTSGAPTKPAADAQRNVQPAPEAELSPVELERKSLAKAKPKSKTAKIRSKSRNTDAAWRSYPDKPEYSSYAQERPAGQFSAEGTLGPH